MGKKETYPHELIGEKVKIVDSKNKSNVNIIGKVVDETKMTIKIDCLGKIKTLLKNNIQFMVVRNGQIVNGKEITKRPEERLKGR